MRLEQFINEGHKEIKLKGDTHEERIFEIITLLFKNCKLYLKDLKGTDWVLYRGARGGEMELITPRPDRSPKDMSPELQELLDDEFERKFHWRPRSEGVFCSGSYKQANAYGSAVYTVWPIGKYDFIYSDDVHDLYTSTDHLNNKIKYLDDPDEYEDDWEDEYGEGTNGSWYYDGEDTQMKDTIDAEEVVHEWLRDKEEFETEEDEETWEPPDLLPEDFEWVPGMAKEDYIENAIEEKKEEIEEEISDVVRDFTNDNIQNAIDSHNEVMLSCESYYLIKDRFTNDILEQIKLGPPSKQKQLKFQFTYKKKRRK